MGEHVLTWFESTHAGLDEAFGPGTGDTCGNESANSSVFASRGRAALVQCGCFLLFKAWI